MWEGSLMLTWISDRDRMSTYARQRDELGAERDSFEYALTQIAAGGIDKFKMMQIANKTLMKSNAQKTWSE